MSNALSQTSIDTEQVIGLLEQALAPKSLKPLQRLIIQASWQGLSYLQMAEAYQYDAGHLRDIGSELWQSLSLVLGRRVQKRDLRGIIHQLAQYPSARGTTSLPRESVLEAQPFYGREKELQILSHWLVEKRCRLVSVYGLEGIGKTALAARVAHQLQDHFQQIVWWNFSGALPLALALPHWLSSLTQGRVAFLPNTMAEQWVLFFSLLKERRSLLILDNLEELFQSEEYAAKFRSGYEDYGHLFKKIAEEEHQSCVLILSREQCKKCSVLTTTNPFIQQLGLNPLDLFSTKQIFADQGIQLSHKTLTKIHQYYQGNPLIFKILATTHQDYLASHNHFSEQVITDSNILFQDILGGLFLRLTQAEQAIVYYLANQPQAIAFDELALTIIPKISTKVLLQALNSLKRRSLLHLVPTEQGNEAYTLAPLWKDFLIDYFIQQYPLTANPCPKILVGAWEYELNTEKMIWSPEIFQLLDWDIAKGEPNYDQMLQLHLPEDQVRLQQTVNRIIETGESYCITLRHLCPDSSLRYVESIGHLEYDTQGKPRRLHGITQDVTYRMQAVSPSTTLSIAPLSSDPWPTDAVAVNSSYLIYPPQTLEVIQFSRSQIYENLNQTYGDIPLGYYSLNSQGKLVYINQTILDLLGYEKEELFGRSMADLLIHELKDCFRINYPIFKKRGEVKHQQLLMQHKNGQQVPVMMNAKVIRDEQNKFLMTRTFIMEL